jgi:preprotein translocase subunit SecD
LRLALVLCLAGTAAAADDTVLSFRSAKGAMDLGAASIVSVTAGPDGFGGTAVMLTLDPAAAGELAALTGRSLDLVMEVLVCGQVVAAPVVQEAILGGQVMIAGPGTQKAAAHLAALEGRGGCP